VIELILPYPLSSNRYWRPVNIGKHITIVPTKEAKAYKAEVAYLARQAGVRQPLQGRIALHVQLYPQRPQDWARRVKREPLTWDDDVRCIDLGNAEKVLSDALNGVAWLDDKQHRRILLERMEPDGDARMVVRIEPLALPSSPQADLLGAAA
jgi:crossover junction endodeoxyribonuclease RusA